MQRHTQRSIHTRHYPTLRLFCRDTYSFSSLPSLSIALVAVTAVTLVVFGDGHRVVRISSLSTPYLFEDL